MENLRIKGSLANKEGLNQKQNYEQIKLLEQEGFRVETVTSHLIWKNVLELEQESYNIIPIRCNVTLWRSELRWKILKIIYQI